MINEAKRGYYFLKKYGPVIALRKGFIYYVSRLTYVKNQANKLNSKKYWETRFRSDWQICRGDLQTMLFASAATTCLDLSKYSKSTSLLDYGCGTCDSAPIWKIALPGLLELNMFDLSEHAMKIGIDKYERFVPCKKADLTKKYDLVYCSNVIEHIEDVSTFLTDLLSLSSKFIIIQAPWNELHPMTGEKLTPQSPSGEHVQTLDDDFLERYLRGINYTLSYAEVPLAWQGGTQVFIEIELK